MPVGPIQHAAERGEHNGGDEQSSAFHKLFLRRISRSYLLLHQTETPAKTTISGSKNWLVSLTQFICALVSVMRRSSGSLGRMEIKSSSEESQFMALSARSRLPLKLMKELAAQAELPITTKRPCEFSFPVL